MSVFIAYIRVTQSTHVQYSEYSCPYSEYSCPDHAKRTQGQRLKFIGCPSVHFLRDNILHYIHKHNSAATK